MNHVSTPFSGTTVTMPATTLTSTSSLPVKVVTLKWTPCAKKLKDAAKACGIKQNIGTHTLRKTFGYFHYQSNHDIVFLQRLFGHSSALITMRYIGIADEEEKKAYHDVSIDLLGDI